MGATEAAGDSKAAEGETVTERERERTQRERFKLFLLRGDYPFRYSTYIARILCSLRPPSNFSPPFCRFCDSPCIQYFLFDIRERFAFGFGCGLWFAVSKKRHRYDYSYKLISYEK